MTDGEGRNALQNFCANCLLTNFKKCVIIGGPLTDVRAGISIIPQPQHFVKRKIA